MKTTMEDLTPGQLMIYDSNLMAHYVGGVFILVMKKLHPEMVQSEDLSSIEEGKQRIKDWMKRTYNHQRAFKAAANEVLSAVRSKKAQVIIASKRKKRK